MPENGKLEIEIAGDLASMLMLSSGNKKRTRPVKAALQWLPEGRRSR